LFEVSIKEIRSVPGIEGYRNMESSTDYRKQANRTGWIPSLTAQSSSLLLIDDLTFPGRYSRREKSLIELIILPVFYFSSSAY